MNWRRALRDWRVWALVFTVQSPGVRAIVRYAPDPALSNDPTSLLRKPAMAAAYAYAGSNPIGNIDPSGLEFFTVQSRASVVAAHADARAFVSRNPAVARSIVDSHQTSLPRGLVSLGVNIKQADRVQKFSEALEPNALVEIDLDAGTVKLGAPYGKRIKIPRNAPGAAGANTAAPPRPTTAAPQANNAAPQDATNGNGGPANGAPNNPAPNANAVQPTSVDQAVNPPPQVNNSPLPPSDAQGAVQKPPRVRQRANSAPANLTRGARADE